MSSHDRFQYPSHLQPVPDSGDLGARRRCRRPRSRATPGADPAAAPRPLARLHHRRPGRTRLRHPRSWCSRRSSSAQRRAARPRRCCSSRARSPKTSSRGRPPSATASTTSTSPSTSRRRRRGALPGDDGAPLQGGPGRLRRPAHAAGRRRRPGQRARRRRHPDRHRPRLPASRSPPKSRRRVAARPPRHAAERRRRGDHRGARRRGRASRRTLAAVSEMQVGAEDAPVIKLVYSILAQAVGEGASDVHLEPEEGELRVRFRVDGVLKEAAHVPKRMIGAVISRLKIMSELDIAEKRVPQDGRVSVAVEERRIDLRVTTLPTQRGEGATIRILDESNAAAHARRPRHGRRRPRPASRTPSGRPTAPCWSPARPARASRTTLYAALARAERDREEDHHDRGPGRVPDRRHQPDQRQPQGGARLRHAACARSCAPTPTS